MADQKEVVIPTELAAAMVTDTEAAAFFNTLSDGYKRGYCDWVGDAKSGHSQIPRREDPFHASAQAKDAENLSFVNPSIMINSRGDNYEIAHGYLSRLVL